MLRIVLEFVAVLVFLQIIVFSDASVCAGKVTTSLNQKNCTDKATNQTAFYLDKTGCIPKCKQLNPNIDSGTCTAAATNTCSPGFFCYVKICKLDSNVIYSCVTDSDCDQHKLGSTCGDYCLLPNKDGDDSNEVSCMAYHLNYPTYKNTYWSAAKFKPTCDENEQWAPKQCKGGLNGRCFCYSAHGVRLFGESLLSESDDMTCACSRKRSEFKQAGRNYVSIHCDSKGNYEKLQCDTEKKLCWCAEPLTGELTAPLVPKVAMEQLPCYNKGKVGSQYLRQCESKLFAIAMITAKLRTHGVQLVVSDDLICDADGSYGAYRISSGIAYCSWRDNSNIGNWMTNINEQSGKLTCNCARDYKLYGWSLECESTGNYVPLQVITVDEKKKYYCIDEDGFVKSPMLDDSNTNCSLYY